MQWTMQSPLRRCLFVGAVMAGLPLLAVGAGESPNKEPKAGKAPAPVLPVWPAWSERVAIILKDRHGNASPVRNLPKVAHTGGGNTDVVQPQEDVVIITTTGIAVAGPHPCADAAAAMEFNLDQGFEIAFVQKKVIRAKLTAEAFVVGLLRGDKHGGSASVGHAAAAIAWNGVPLIQLNIDGNTIHGATNLAINDHTGPFAVPVQSGEYHLLQTFRIRAAHTRTILGTAACAELAPDPALNPQWISHRDPFANVTKTESGFRVVLRVEPEN